MMKSKAQVIIVKSQQGCGGTYMMNSIANQFTGKGHLVYYLSAEKLSDEVERDPIQVAQHLFSYSVVVVDDLDYLIRRSKLACMMWLRNFLHEFIFGGGKFMFSHTSLEMTVDDWINHLGNYIVVEKLSSYPSSIVILKSIVEKYIHPSIINQYAEKAHNNSNSIREFVNTLVMYDAKRELAIL